MPNVTPELAGKVLDADLANVIKKVSAGKPLSAGERELMAEFAAHSEDLRARRQAALIRKWAEGGRLTDAEVDEINDIIPAETFTRADREPLPVNPVKRPKYQRAYTDYAARYGVAERTVKSWRKIGADADGDYPPFDAPALMPEWWARRMTQRVPDKLLTAARAAAASDPPPPTSAPAPRSAPPAAPPVARPPLSVSGDLGLSGMLIRLREAEREAHADYMAALRVTDDERNEGDIKIKSKIWSDLANQLRALEKTSPDVLKASGEMVSRAAVTDALREVHAVIFQSIHNLGRRMKTKMRDLADDEFDAAWLAEVERVFQVLKVNEFTAAT
ncbi:MAG: hypothetical protein LBK76_03520 [Verrucomicrobiales bacterium]|jgi:hypothetical protein|nr:hypothetical protein [Verrucomicrobiales bacterium]